jgi:TetR/AcrR family transcriptional repressor of bet genes
MIDTARNVMPRTGTEPARRQALINAAIDMIGENGSTEVTVKEIATRAGMSSALAFHYFGGKDEIIFETMRHLMRELGNSTIARLQKAETPLARLDAVIASSFEGDQFSRTTIAAWLVFYMRALSSDASARLLTIYTRRLRSNILHALRQLCVSREAENIEQGLSAMIDGLYIRHGLRPQGPNADEAIHTCRDFLDRQLASERIE